LQGASTGKGAPLSKEHGVAEEGPGLIERPRSFFMLW